jgi:hypothetical protein
MNSLPSAEIPLCPTMDFDSVHTVMSARARRFIFYALPTQRFQEFCRSRRDFRQHRERSRRLRQGPYYTPDSAGDSPMAGVAITTLGPAPAMHSCAGVATQSPAPARQAHPRIRFVPSHQPMVWPGAAALRHALSANQAIAPEQLLSYHSS